MDMWTFLFQTFQIILSLLSLNPSLSIESGGSGFLGRVGLSGLC